MSFLLNFRSRGYVTSSSIAGTVRGHCLLSRTVRDTCAFTRSPARITTLWRLAVVAGHTFCTVERFQNVVDAIADCAFVTSDLPVILSMEVMRESENPGALSLLPACCRTCLLLPYVVIHRAPHLPIRGSTPRRIADALHAKTTAQRGSAVDFGTWRLLASSELRLPCAKPNIRVCTEWQRWLPVLLLSLTATFCCLSTMNSHTKRCLCRQRT